MTHESRKIVSLDEITVNGQHLTDEVVSDMVSEGPKTLRRRGRPAREGTASLSVTIRFSEAELRLIDDRAKAEHLNRSDFIRKRLALDTSAGKSFTASSPR